MQMLNNLFTMESNFQQMKEFPNLNKNHFTLKKNILKKCFYYKSLNQLILTLENLVMIQVHMLIKIMMKIKDVKVDKNRSGLLALLIRKNYQKLFKIFLKKIQVLHKIV